MSRSSRVLRVEGEDISISNPEKILFTSIGMSKWDYVMTLAKLAPYLLPYCKSRFLTTIRFPDGPSGSFFYQRNVPNGAPKWIRTFTYRDTTYVMLEDVKTLIWLANLACLEFHVSFSIFHKPEFPTDLVFDIDPSTPDFSNAVEVALLTKDALQNIGLDSFVKTSGASGLQVYVPLMRKYTFDDTRLVTCFIAEYLVKQRGDLITLDRKVQKRGEKVYFDYLQHHRGKTLISAYSPRARSAATVSCPLEWRELLCGKIHPTQYTLENIFDRLQEKGDVFKPLLEKERADLDFILPFLKQKR